MFTVPLGWKGLKSFRRLQAFIDCGLDRINEVVRGDRVFQPLRDIKDRLTQLFLKQRKDPQFIMPSVHERLSAHG